MTNRAGRAVGPVLALALAGLVTVTTPGIAGADFTLDQLQLIDELITARRYSELVGFLRDNPQLLQGEDPLARELRILVADSSDARVRRDQSRSIQREVAQALAERTEAAPVVTRDAAAPAAAPVSGPSVFSPPPADNKIADQDEDDDQIDVDDQVDNDGGGLGNDDGGGLGNEI